jgi:hypothetical protein
MGLEVARLSEGGFASELPCFLQEGAVVVQRMRKMLSWRRLVLGACG